MRCNSHTLTPEQEEAPRWNAREREELGRRTTRRYMFTCGGTKFMSILCITRALTIPSSCYLQGHITCFFAISKSQSLIPEQLALSLSALDCQYGPSVTIVHMYGFAFNSLSPFFFFLYTCEFYPFPTPLKYQLTFS